MAPTLTGLLEAASTDPEREVAARARISNTGAVVFIVLGAFVALLLIIAFASDQRDRRQGREVPSAAELRVRIRGAKRKAREDRRRLRLPTTREVDNVTLNSRAEPLPRFDRTSDQ